MPEPRKRRVLALNLLAARAAHASFGATLDASVCSGSRSPNVHHRVWVGEACPPVQDLVSLVAAALLLQPERIGYIATHPWWESTGCAHVAQCHRAFGVEYRRFDLSNPADPFVSSTTGFKLYKKMTRAQCTTSEKRCFRREHISDFMRLFAVNEQGGYYLDADSFVVDARLHDRFASCPFAVFSAWLSSQRGDGEDAYQHVNNGAFMAAANSTFGAAWWRYFSQWDGSLWRCCRAHHLPEPHISCRSLRPTVSGVRASPRRSDHSCGWPGRRAKAHSEEVHVAPVMFVPAPFVAAVDSAPSRDEPNKRDKRKAPRMKAVDAIDVDGAVASGVSLVHLTNWKARAQATQFRPLACCLLPTASACSVSQVRPSNVTRPVLLNVLERAVRTNGWKQLTAARRHCVGELRARLQA